MATVYLAIQQNFEREVALKIMSSALSEDRNFSERFLREARIVSRLIHPHIVTVHDVGIQNGHHYLSMEYIPGQDLRHRLAGLSGEQLFRVLREVASALDYAGRKGYVHRDVKPENIMLHAEDGRAVLMDFGIARAADAQSTMTRTGTALGTPHYMSPEQAKGDAIDGRSDLYSLGVLLFYMMTGKVPYDAESAVAIGIKHLTDPVPGLPDALSIYQPLINKLMAKPPSDRYQAGCELIDDLQHFDVRPLTKWLLQKGTEFEGRVDHTPLRGSPIPPENYYNTTLPIASGSQTHAVKKHNDKTASIQPDRTRLDLGIAEIEKRRGSQHREAITIPKEDLREREQQSVRSSNTFFLIVVLMISLCLGGGYYYKDELIATETFKLLADKIELYITGNEAARSQQDVDSLSSPIEQNQDKMATNVIEQKEGILLSENEASEPEAAVDRAGEVQIDSSDNRTTVVDGPPVSELPSQQDINGLAQLLQRSRELLALVQKQPERTPELIALLQKILGEQPGQLEATQALAQAMSNVLLVADDQIAKGSLDAARQSLDNAVAWFPELLQNEKYLNVNERFKVATQIGELLQQAKGHLDNDRLVRPATGNAMDTLNKVLVMEPDNEKAREGLQRVVTRYFELATAAYQQRDYKKVQVFINNGLSIDPSYKPLLALQQQTRTGSERERKIASLLMQAQILESQDAVFGKEQSAAAYYRSVLALDPQQIDAKQALERLVKSLLVNVELLAAAKDYSQAIALVSAASATLPNDQRLQARLQQLNANKPAIDQLLLSGDPIVDANSVMSETVKADRTLHIAFHYQGLDAGATVLQALLFDGARSVQIAAVPVVVKGNSGSTQFRVDRPVEGFTGGGYHLDILLAGKRIFTDSFVITQ